MRRRTYAELVALSMAEREPIVHTAQGISVVVFNGIDYWAYTPPGVREAAAKAAAA